MSDTSAVRRSRHRRIVALALPAIGSLVADPLLGAVDTAVAGRLGTEQLGALGLSVGVLGAVTWIFNFLVLGTTTTVARAMGRGDHDAAGRRVSHAAVAALAIGVTSGLVLAVAAPALVRAFGAVEGLVDPSVTYLRVRAVGVPFALLAYVGHGAFRGVADTRTPLVVVVVANVVNGALDVVLVYGLGIGLAGIAWATVAAEVVAVLMFVVLVRRAGLPLAGHGLPNRDQVRDLVVVSRDIFLRTGGLVLGLLLVTAAAARIGEVTAAAHQVMWQTFLLLAFLLDGFAIAGQSMVGAALGAGDVDEARGATRDLLRWGAGGGVVLALLLVVLRDPVVAVFTDEPEVVARLGGAWLLLAAVVAVGAFAFLLDGVGMGAADFAYLRTWTVAGGLVGGAAAQLGATLGGGLVWLWWSMLLVMAVRAVALLLRVRGTAWLDTTAV